MFSGCRSCLAETEKTTPYFFNVVLRHWYTQLLRFDGRHVCQGRSCRQDLIELRQQHDAVLITRR